MPTKVVNLNKERYDVYIGRGAGERGLFGNPHVLDANASSSLRALCIEKFETYFLERLETDAYFKRRVHELKGKTLGCFCKPKQCHGDVIAKYLDALPD